MIRDRNCLVLCREDCLVLCREDSIAETDQAVLVVI